MPFIDLETNLPASRFSEDFLKKLGSATAAALGKPEDVSVADSYFIAQFLADAETLHEVSGS